MIVICNNREQTLLSVGRLVEVGLQEELNSCSQVCRTLSGRLLQSGGPKLKRPDVLHQCLPERYCSLTWTSVFVSVSFKLTDVCLTEIQTAVSVPRTNSSTTVDFNLSRAAPVTDAPLKPDPSSSSPVLYFLTVNWTSKCEGHLILHHPSTPSHVCHSKHTTVQSLLTNVCKNKKGCKDLLRWERGEEVKGGFNISVDRAEPTTSCEALTVKCTG